ncbi:hypothetical protein HZB88_02475 [archaeon]|nr:hypothetical protein [archaeon]
MPKEEDNRFFLSYLKETGSKAFCIVTANHLHEALDLYEAGADYVIVPHIMSGEHIANLLENHLNDATVLKGLRHRHLKHLLELYTER